MTGGPRGPWPPGARTRALRTSAPPRSPRQAYARPATDEGAKRGHEQAPPGQVQTATVCAAHGRDDASLKPSHVCEPFGALGGEGVVDGVGSGDPVGAVAF